MSQFTHAYLQGPNGGTLHGPYGSVFSGPNEPGVDGLNVPRARAAIGTEDPYTAADQTWCTDNVELMWFSRSFTDAARDPFLGASTVAQQYVNFTTITAAEYAAWGPSGNGTFLDAWLATHPTSLSGYYETIGTGTERLCDITNTDWLDFRLEAIPGWNLTDKLGDTNLSAFSIDLCPLFPVDNLCDDGDGWQLPTEFADADAWKAGMIAMIKYVRQRIDPSIKLVVNGLRQFNGESQTVAGGNQQSQPVAWEAYDGRDLFDPGVAADLVGMEFDAGPTSLQEMLWSLRVMARAEQSEVKWGVSTKFDHTSAADADEIRKRWTNLALYSLAHGDHGLINQVSNQSISPYPIPFFPENALELGTPDQALFTWLTDPTYATNPTAQVYVRTFDSGYITLFNYTGASTTPVAVPAAYRQNYRMLTATTEVEIVAGQAAAAMSVEPNVPDLLEQNQGIILLATTDYTRIKLKLDGVPETAFINQADGYEDEHFILTPGSPAVFLDGDEKAVLFNGESSYANVPYAVAFDKFFMRDSAPGQTAWSQYVEFEIDRASFANTSFQDVFLQSFRGLADIYLKYDAIGGVWNPACRIYSTSIDKNLWKL